MASKTISRTFKGAVYSLISAGEEGQEILHIRVVDGDGENIDLQLNIVNGRALAETLKLKIHSR
jgi:hypothetical protein